MPNTRIELSRRDVLIGGATGLGGLVVGAAGIRALDGVISGAAASAPTAPGRTEAPTATPSPTETPEATPSPTASPSATPSAEATKSPDAAAAVQRPASINWEKPKPKEALKLRWTDGKYQTFPRLVFAAGLPGVVEAQTEGFILQEIDLGTLGPDVDTIAGIDFLGDIPTGAAIVYQPTEGPILETRVVFIKRTDIETVQFHGALGGDRFDVYRASQRGGDHALDVTARLHAANTARKHQKVVYLGDLGLFEKQWGEGEKPLLNAIIRAQRPAAPAIGIQEPDFVQKRVFTP